MARMVLICCEGKTEKEYFDILRYRVFRIPGYMSIRIEGEKGQHKALIDRTVELRRDYALSEDLSESDIECWAVCDDDGMPISFHELKAYAETNGVNLAFSSPQFECYLMQHFEQSRETDKSSLYDRLGSIATEAGFVDGYDKADLSWMEKLLVDKPKLVEVAIVNSDQRLNRAGRPFLTVQSLVRRMKELARY